MTHIPFSPFAKDWNLVEKIPRCCGFAILLTLWSPNAFPADDADMRDTVATRARPEVDPLGAHVGSFLVNPKIAFAYLYDDNVFATSSGEKEGSYATETSPEVAIRSNWSEHALNLIASASLGWYADFPNENYSDWLISTDGRLDLSPYIQLTGGVSSRSDHILRTSPENTSNLDEPITYDETAVFGGYFHTFGHFRLGLDAAVHQQDYHDALGPVGGVQMLIDEDYRDRTLQTANLRFGYQNIPGQEYFLLMKWDRRDYEEPDPVINVERSSDGSSVSFGMTFDLNGIAIGELSAGYLRQDYEDPFPDIDTPLFGASLDWNVTRLSTVKLIIQREIGETTSSYFSGYVRTSTLLGIDHELRRHVLVNLSLNYLSDDYQGIDPAEREDKTYDFFMGPVYLINRNFQVSAMYHRMKRDSTDNTLAAGVSNDYLKNIILIQLQAQL